MKKRDVKWLLAVLAAGLIMMPQSILAQHQGGTHEGMHGGMQHPEQTTMGAQTGSMEGKIVEMAERTIVVEGAHQGKVHRMTLMMDEKTKKEGVLKPGSQVQVKYRSSTDGMLYATALKGPKPKS